MLGHQVSEEYPTEVCHEKEIKLEQSWNSETKIGTNSFTEGQLVSVHTIAGNPGITIIIPTAPKPSQKDPDPLLMENIKLEEDIEDLNIIEMFDSELESHYDQNNAIIKSEVDFKHGKISEEMSGRTGTVYQCSQEGCEFKTSIKSSLIRHRKNIHGIINDNRNKRIKDENGRRVYQCSEEGCTWKGVTKLRLEQHVKRIHVPLPPKVYECDQCEYKTTSKRNSIRHRKSHEGPTKDQPLPCEMCGKMCTSKTMLTNHLIKEHGKKSIIPENCIRCGQCKSIVEKDKLESHVCVKKNKCKECGEMFYNNGDKTKHFAAIHSELLPTSNCEICGKVFRGIEIKQQMEKHSKIHTQGYIECPQCGKKVRDLDSHIATMHTKGDELKHKCSYCGKSFLKKTGLQKHIDSIHLDARKYPCRYGCSFRYNDSSNRNAHEKKKHGALHSRSDNPIF